MMKYKIMIILGVLCIGVFFLVSDLFFFNTTPDIGSEEWVYEKIKAYPEISWLGGKGVRQTHDMQNGGIIEEDQSPSFRIYGQKYPEFDRTILSLMSLNWFVKGGEESYKAFTASQKEPDKLSYGQFSELHKRYVKLIASGVTLQDFEIALVLGDTGKTEAARAEFGGIKVSDHDEFLKEALHKNPSLFPSFKKLTHWAQKTLPEISGILHFGHFLHLEGGVEMILPLMKARIVEEDPKSLEFDFLIHMADVSGAGGHINPTSSIVMTDNVYRALMAIDASLNLLKKNDTTAIEVLESYIQARALWIGLNLKTPKNRVLTRLSAMIRLYGKEDGSVLNQAFEKFDETQKSFFIKMFDPLSPDLPEITPTYIPALLANLYNNKSLGETPEQRLSRTLEIGLPFVSRVLKRYQDQLSEGKGNRIDPLNFNDMARVAKESPEKLSSLSILIDAENNVLERKD